MATLQKKKSRTGLWIGILTTVFVIVALLAIFTRKDEKPQVTLEKVEKRTLVASVSESGTVRPKIEVKVAPDVSGEVVELRFHEGDRVKKGDLLVTIRPDNYKSALQQSQASVNSAEANHMQAKSALASARTKFLQDSANFKRNDDLYKQKVISQSEWENYRLQFEVSRSSVESANQQVQAAYFQMQSAKASMEQAKLNLNRTSIYASMDGIITTQNVELGERVVGTIQMAGTEMLRIADLSRMEVTVNINENDIVSLRNGDSAEVEVDAYRDRKFKGRVTEIAYSASTNQTGTTDQITNFEVKVEIDPASYQNDASLMRGLSANDSPFRPGMTARVTIFTERKENVIAVPIGAVTLKKREAGQKGVLKPIEIVYLFENGKTKEVTVKSGVSDDEYIEITEGLKGGETLITGPYLILTKTLHDDMQVEEKKEKPVAEEKDKKKKNPKEQNVRGEENSQKDNPDDEE